jgi:hypothetical protein
MTVSELNHFIPIYGLPFMINYQNQKELKITTLINSLKIDDVKEDSSYAKTIAKIKSEVAISLVEIQDPVHKDFKYDSTSRQYVHDISFPFTGDKELFRLTPPSGISFGGSDHGIIAPLSNSIIVHVPQTDTDPQKAISSARQLLRLTISIAESNNVSLKDWNERTAQRVESELAVKREELIRFFGNK